MCLKINCFLWYKTQQHTKTLLSFKTLFHLFFLKNSIEVILLICACLSVLDLLTVYLSKHFCNWGWCWNFVCINLMQSHTFFLNYYRRRSQSSFHLSKVKQTHVTNICNIEIRHLSSLSRWLKYFFLSKKRQFKHSLTTYHFKVCLTSLGSIISKTFIHPLKST